MYHYCVCSFLSLARASDFIQLSRLLLCCSLRRRSAPQCCWCGLKCGIKDSTLNCPLEWDLWSQSTTYVLSSLIQTACFKLLPKNFVIQISIDCLPGKMLEVVHKLIWEYTVNGIPYTILFQNSLRPPSSCNSDCPRPRNHDDAWLRQDTIPIGWHFLNRCERGLWLIRWAAREYMDGGDLDLCGLDVDTNVGFWR